MAGDAGALSFEAKRGLEVFESKGQCAACQNGPDFTDWEFHNIGVDSDNQGHGKVQDSNDDKAEYQGAFKTPGLRNVALTAPYLQDGSLGTLEDVVEFYDRGGDRKNNLSPLIKPLGLTDRKKWDLVVFLGALTHTIDVQPPIIPGLSAIE